MNVKDSYNRQYVIRQLALHFFFRDSPRLSMIACGFFKIRVYEVVQRKRS